MALQLQEARSGGRSSTIERTCSAAESRAESPWRQGHRTSFSRCAPSARTLRRGALAVSVSMALTACGTNPFIFSTRLNTYPSDPAVKPPPRVELAGRLDLALMALMDQRDQLWTAANDTETMKNWTALGLIGLGAVGIYKGLDAESHRTWLRKVGLGAAAVYAGATWLEPSARQRIYLAGAMSLTCLALVAAPYEMTMEQFNDERKNINRARWALEQVYAELAMLPTKTNAADASVIRKARSISVFATRMLNSADETLGNIEKVGTRMRDMSALTASEVSKQVSSVSRDLSQLPDAIKALQPQANLLLGTQIFSPPPPQSAADGTDSTAGDAKSTKSSDATSTGSCPAPEVVTPAAPAASAPAVKNSGAQKPAAAASAASGAASSATAEPAALDLGPLKAALTALAEPLGQAISLVRRVQATRTGQELPAACGTKQITLFPSDRSIVLKPGASFQYVLSGDEGRPGVQVLTAVPPPDTLDISLPALQTAAAVRFTAGASIKQQVDTVVRISDSGKTQQFDISVRLCASASTTTADAK